ncbi:hypothetical protein C2S51_018838 [Perilla frutescens var. frutescens]|nr:hypothetical protein C2S51_018838 [Perilla frutescens var. frutescens]
MESNRSNNKRKGFAKSKLLMSFYRGSKPKSDSSFELVAPPPPPPPLTTAAVGFIIVKQDHQVHTNVAFVVPDRNGGCAKLESFYGGAPEDDAVDAKAARYISTVKERFGLERVNSERKN